VNEPRITLHGTELSGHLIGAAVSWGSRQLQRLVPYSPSNPYLEGAFAPVDAETTAMQLTVRGSIPQELQGILARIGPNPMQVANPAVYHWFIGDGMVHGIRLRDGTAEWYRSRWVGTDSVNRRLKRPRARGPRHGTSDVVNTNIVGHAGRVWALVEAGAVPVELDGELNTLRHGYFASPLSRAYTAHPHRDPRTGELHAICYDSLSRNKVRYVVVDSQGSVVRDVAIPVRHGPMIHDCAITARYVLIFDLPITFSFGALLHGATFPYRWNPRHPARVGVLPRTGDLTKLRWFEIEPCQLFHTANAYELDDGSVVVDAVVYQRVFDRSRQGLETSQTRLERWRLDSERGCVERKVFSDCKQEFPRFDERRAMHPYRYAYTIGIDVEQIGPQPLYRLDLETGRVLRHDFGPHHVPSEALFVPREADGAEDDGWLFSYVYDMEADRSAVVIVNAQDLGGDPQAVIELPVRVPLGFHGNWIPDAV
jgi:8'-apo-carotenoid 13,14-cleaving dioxygenase